MIQEHQLKSKLTHAVELLSLKQYDWKLHIYVWRFDLKQHIEGMLDAM